ncbi:ABC transporter permease [Nigerium massiliense]|uniref:ABC transporter permease n=1 Tax=Nigerium massiliense TaxID=1522317 RepID=UPI00058EB65D|nr:ABC transporter permease [Nigerium massiliense]
MSLDLSPAAAPAARGRRIGSHARMEASLLLRNGEQLLLALVIPVALLVAGLVWGGRVGLDPQAFPASVLALAVWSTSFTSLAINTGFERRYGVFERLAATPLTRGDLIGGKALATAAVAAGQLVLLAAVALALGWRPQPTLAGTVPALVGVVLAMLAFAGVALALAGRVSAETTLAVANLIYLAVAAGGALVLPLSAYPAALRPLLAALPSGALGELLRGWASGAAPLWPLAVLAAWTVVLLFLARKAFRWTS